jgi:hypothetical protein
VTAVLKAYWPANKGDFYTGHSGPATKAFYGCMLLFTDIEFFPACSRTLVRGEGRQDKVQYTLYTVKNTEAKN